VCGCVQTSLHYRRFGEKDDDAGNLHLFPLGVHICSKFEKKLDTRFQFSIKIYSQRECEAELL